MELWSPSLPVVCTDRVHNSVFCGRLISLFQTERLKGTDLHRRQAVDAGWLSVTFGHGPTEKKVCI